MADRPIPAEVIDSVHCNLELHSNHKLPNRFFDKITFRVCPDEEEKNAFFLDQVSHFCATIEIQFDSQSEYGAEQLHEILRGYAITATEEICY